MSTKKGDDIERDAGLEEREECSKQVEYIEPPSTCVRTASEHHPVVALQS